MEFNNQRKAYGAALMDLGEGNPDVVVLDADLGNSISLWRTWPSCGPSLI